MKKTRLFAVLQAMPAREVASFRHFLSSPLFNRRADVVSALDFLTEKRNHPHDRRALFAAVFPGKIYSETEVDLLASRLLKLLEDFLACRTMLNDAGLKKIHLAKAYRKLQLERHFETAVREARLLLDKQELRNAAILRHRFDLEDEFYDYVASPNRSQPTNLQAVSDTFDAYFLATKLKQACLHLSRQTINQEHYEIGLLDAALQYIESHPDCLKLPAVAVHFYCYKVVAEVENEAHFPRLRQAIFEHGGCFQPGELRDIYFLAINYCIRRLNAGAQNYIREAFELFRNSLGQGFILEDGVFPESTFSNIVSLGLKLGEFEWTGKFIGEHGRSLKSDVRESILQFNTAKLLYEQGKRRESMRQLVQVNTKAPFLALGAKILQLKIYFELGEMSALDSLLDTLRIYLQRRKDLGYRKKNYENILFFTRRLLELPPTDLQAAERLRAEILQAEPLTEKEWFVRQMEVYS